MLHNKVMSMIGARMDQIEGKWHIDPMLLASSCSRQAYQLLPPQQKNRAAAGFFPDPHPTSFVLSIYFTILHETNTMCTATFCKTQREYQV